MKLRAVVLVGLLACQLVSAKGRDWKTGILEETIQTKGASQAPQVVVMGSPPPSYGNPAIAGASSAASSAAAIAASQPRTMVVQGYRIEGNGYSFMVACNVTRGRVPNVTVHGPIKYTIEDGTFYILDEDRREFKATVLEKALLQQPPASPTVPPAAPKP
jgi:hypothetical protein